MRVKYLELDGSITAEEGYWAALGTEEGPPGTLTVNVINQVQIRSTYIDVLAAADRTSDWFSPLRK